MEIQTACKYFSDGFKEELVLTTDPATIDKIVCQTDRIPPKTFRIFHSGDKGTWTSKDPRQDYPQGFVCNYCHEPVIAYLALMESKQVRHVRQLRGCTMIMMDASSLPWWLEIDAPEFWNAMVDGVQAGLRGSEAS